MTEIKIGDSGWIDLPDKMIESIIGEIAAEETEKRIWRPLETVIGVKDFMGGLDE